MPAQCLMAVLDLGREAPQACGRFRSQVVKRYHKPLAPCDRLLEDARVAEGVRQRVVELGADLDPVRLPADAALSRSCASIAKMTVPIDQFVSGLHTAWRDGEARPTSKPKPKAEPGRRRTDRLVAVTRARVRPSHTEPVRVANIARLILGYADRIDHYVLYVLDHDPAIAAAIDKPGGALACKSTLNRLEHVSKVGQDRHPKLDNDLGAIERLLVDLSLDAHAVLPTNIVIDLDAIDDRTTALRKAVTFTAITTPTSICRFTSSVAGICWWPRRARRMIFPDRSTEQTAVCAVIRPTQRNVPLQTSIIERRPIVSPRFIGELIPCASG